MSPRPADKAAENLGNIYLQNSDKNVVIFIMKTGTTWLIEKLEK